MIVFTTRAAAAVTASAAATTLVLLSGPVSAVAASRAVPVTPLQSSTNLLPRPDRTEALTSAHLASQQCPARKRSAKPPKLSRALKTASGVAAARISTRGMTVFRKSAQYDSVKSLRKLEAAAGADDRRLPTLLAIQLRLHQLSPRDPGPLVDAAGILANLNKPREALALLDAADKTHRTVAAPLGMNGTAIALNNRGYALLRLGQYPQAKRVLSQAIKKEPLLSEARTNRSAANLCQRPEQLWFNAGMTRSPDGPAKLPPVDVNVTVAPPSPGLTPIEIPEARSWDQIGGSHAALNRWYDALLAQWGSKTAPKVKDPLLINSGETTRAVYDAFMHTMAAAWSDDPRLHGASARDLAQAIAHRNHEMQYGDGSAWKCAWQIGWYYDEFRPAYNRHRRQFLSFAADFQRLASEFANSLANDDARALLRWHAQQDLLANQMKFVFDLRWQTDQWSPKTATSPGCTLGDRTPNPDDPDPAISVPDNGCLIQIPVLDTGYVEFQQNCEERYVELHVPGPLAPFFRVSQHVRTGNVTFMSGGKASVTLLRGGKIVKGGVSTKIGVYATFTSANPLHPGNRMVDAGVVKPRVTGSVKISAVKVSAPVSSVVSSYTWPGGRL